MRLILISLFGFLCASILLVSDLNIPTGLDSFRTPLHFILLCVFMGIQIESLLKLKKTLDQKQESKPKEANSEDLITLLCLLQEKGRLIDFLKEDISGRSNEEISAAARYVHQGCSRVVNDYLDIKPLVSASCGSEIAITKEEDLLDYKILGTVSELPKTGILRHQGWYVHTINLPKRIVRPEESIQSLNTINQAELDFPN